MHALVTCFPGFLARRLVARLLGGDPGRRVTALVEERMAGAARAAAGALDGERIELVTGDVGERSAWVAHEADAALMPARA